MLTTAKAVLFCVSATVFVLAGSSPLLAEATQKILDENEKVKVIDVVDKPGDTGAMMSRLGSVVYVVAGGTMERTYADRTKEVSLRKVGAVFLVKEKRAYSVKNIGKTTIHLIEIVPK